MRSGDHEYEFAGGRGNFEKLGPLGLRAKDWPERAAKRASRCGRPGQLIGRVFVFCRAERVSLADHQVPCGAWIKSRHPLMSSQLGPNLGRPGVVHRPLWLAQCPSSSQFLWLSAGSLVALPFACANGKANESVPGPASVISMQIRTTCFSSHLNESRRTAAGGSRRAREATQLQH